MTYPKFARPGRGRAGVAAGGLWLLVAPAAVAASSGAAAEAAARQAWRESMAQTAAPHAGCFEAGYPGLDWQEVSCTDAPNRPYGRKAGTRPQATGGQGLGDAYDARPATGHVFGAIGSFPRADARAMQAYSLQLNSNPQVSGECLNGEFCDAWQQFVYSSGTGTAFIQYWALGSGTSCPAGWTLRGGNCYRNSAAVRVPKLSIGALSETSLGARATSKGDQLIFITSNRAYSVFAPDDVVGLSTFWQEATFNVYGDGGEKELQFASGSSLEIRIGVDGKTDGTPECIQGIDWSSEMNNMNLGPCSAFGGRDPNVRFTESQ